mgnify:CR=1 FL=1
MKEIKRTFGNITPAMQYNLVEGSPEKLSEKQEAFNCEAWVFFADGQTSDGKDKNVLSLLTTEGEALATNSATFIDGFLTYWDMCEKAGVSADQITVKVDTGLTKGGRTFIRCKAC